MPELVGFQTMVILDSYGMTFDAVGVFGLVSFKVLSFAKRSHNSYYCLAWLRTYNLSQVSQTIS